MVEKIGVKDFPFTSELRLGLKYGRGFFSLCGRIGRGRLWQSHAPGALNFWQTLNSL